MYPSDALLVLALPGTVQLLAETSRGCLRSFSETHLAQSPSPMDTQPRSGEHHAKEAISFGCVMRNPLHLTGGAMNMQDGC